MFSTVLPNWAEGVTAAASVVTLIAIALAVVQIRHVNRQMHREFEMEYLLRFWQLMDRRSPRLRAGKRPTREDRLLIADYLELCEDQIALRGLGRVTDHTWGYWRRDIRFMCESTLVARQIARSTVHSLPHLRILLANSDYDPCDRGRLWRLWNGL